MEDLEDVPEILHSEEQDRRMDGQTDKCKQPVICPQSKREANRPVHFQLCFCDIYLYACVIVKLNQTNKDKYPNIHFELNMHR